MGDYQGLAHQATAFLPLYVQPDVAGAIATDAFISFPPATVVAATARAPQRFVARAAPAAALTAAARQRVSERIRFMRTQRLKSGP